MRPNFFHHLHPPSIPAEQSRFRYTLGAGGLGIFLSLVLLVTGALEMFFYIPSPEQAALSVQTLTYLVPYGGLIRNLHYWAAQALVVVTVVHLLRVIFTGSFVPPRRFNYLLGLGLLALILFLDFTGYALRWDEGVRWALVAGTNLLKTIPSLGKSLYGLVVGGSTLGAATLIRFYSWHVFGLTLAVVILGIWHAFRVRRDGGIAAPPPKQRTNNARISRFELVRREVLAMLLSAAALFVLAALLPAPIAAPIQAASDSLGEARAPWFFLWIQQLLRLGNPFWMGVAIPLIALTTFAALPYLFETLPTDQQGHWFPRAGRGAQAIAAGIVLAWLVLTILESLR
ncbi:MAG: hypothetical protein GXP40_04005 [Chloroflexi bacterium]|nr:hypothetical protein [Chloroflexota bacterium]